MPLARQWSFIGVSLCSLDSITGKPTLALKITKHSVKVDDSRLKFTPEMREWYESQLLALECFFRQNRNASQSCWRWWHRFCLWILTPFMNSFLGRFVGLPPCVTKWNLSVDRIYSPKALCSYNHFYGGCQPNTVLNDWFELYLRPPSLDGSDEGHHRPALRDLHIADASVIPQLKPGGPSATIMEHGMLVADQVLLDIEV